MSSMDKDWVEKYINGSGEETIPENTIHRKKGAF